LQADSAGGSVSHVTDACVPLLDERRRYKRKASVAARADI
jgi:hypothetical protein